MNLNYFLLQVSNNFFITFIKNFLLSKPQYLKIHMNYIFFKRLYFLNVFGNFAKNKTNLYKTIFLYLFDIEAILLIFLNKTKYLNSNFTNFVINLQCNKNIKNKLFL